MVFCTKCGKKVSGDARFCQNCGTPLPVCSGSNSTKRQQEYVGSVRRCPSCGMELPSLTAVCPGCGHEINDAKISKPLALFVARLEKCDRNIASCPEVSKKGWGSWGIIKKVSWIVLNLCLCCTPLALYLLWKLFRMNRMPALTIDEKNKADLIENYLFPDNRGTILETLLFIKSKVFFLADQKADAKHVYWSRLWTKKAEQLYQRSELLFPGDLVANRTYQEIVSSSVLVQKKMRKKILMAGGTTIAVIILITVCRSMVLSSQNTPLEWPENGLSQVIPAIKNKRGEITFNTDELYRANIKGFSDTEYEMYLEACRERGFVIEADRENISYEAFNEEGCHLKLIYMTSNNELSIQVDAAMEMSKLVWPKSEIAKLLPVPESNTGNIEWEADYGFVIYVGDITKEQYQAYVDACFACGFTEDYQRGKDYFHARNADGYKVDIDYRGFNTMFVRVDQPE